MLDNVSAEPVSFNIIWNLYRAQDSGTSCQPVRFPFLSCNIAASPETAAGLTPDCNCLQTVSSCLTLQWNSSGLIPSPGLIQEFQEFLPQHLLLFLLAYDCTWHTIFKKFTGGSLCISDKHSLFFYGLNYFYRSPTPVLPTGIGSLLCDLCMVLLYCRWHRFFRLKENL